MPLSVFFIQPNHQEKVRRLVSIVSTVVGLLCYSHSTSFVHLFGQWNWWKILLYLLFSCLACLAVLFQEAWNIIIPQHHESVSRFLVVTSTTILLFFSDRASKGKSDAYGVTSCDAFAVMSLTCGFDELLTVFTGALMVQLMGMKLLLGAVGVVLCFIFIAPTPYLQRCLEIQGQGQLQPHHELQSIQHDNRVIIVDIVEDQTQVVSYLPSSISIVEDQDDQRLMGVNDEIQDDEVVDVIDSLESSEDDEDQELMVVEEVASSLQTNNDEDELQELVRYTTLLIQLGLSYLLGVVIWFQNSFWWINYLIYSDNSIHLIFVRYDMVSATMEFLLIFFPDPQSEDERICKDRGRWLVNDVDHRGLLKNDLATSLANILLVAVVAGFANLVNRFHKVLARCSSDILSRMERLTSKTQNALLGSRSIFSFMDQGPTMKIKGLKHD